MNYQNAGCADDDVVYAMAWKNDYCLSFSDPDDDSAGSMLFDWPYQKVYDTSSKCKGSPVFSMDVSALGCQANDDPVQPTSANTFTEYVYVENSAMSRFSVFGIAGLLAVVGFINQFI